MEKDCNLTNPSYIPIDKSRGITAIVDKIKGGLYVIFRQD